MRARRSLILCTLVFVRVAFWEADSKAISPRMVSGPWGTAIRKELFRVRTGEIGEVMYDGGWEVGRCVRKDDWYAVGIAVVP